LSAERRVVPAARQVQAASFPDFEALRESRVAARAPEGGARLAADVEAQRARGRAEGFAEGRREGQAAACEEWRARLAAASAALEAVTHALIVHRSELAAEVERQLPRLLDRIVRRVLHQELASTETAARAVIRGLAQRLAGGERPVVVRVAPPLVEALEHWRQAAPEGGATPALHIEAGPELAPGDWMIDTGEGVLDGRVEAQLDAAWSLAAEPPP
jgi:flagellar biosynthesis/type III secretory pathway protein FliH